jgi:diguanylate cyclase (GGDEF)-like protein
VDRNELNKLLDKFGIEDIFFDLVNSLSAVKGLSEIDSNVSDEKALVVSALNVLIDNQDMERCSFYLLDEDQNLVNVSGLSSEEHIAGKALGNYRPSKFKIGEGVIGLAAQTGELQRCNDCANDSRFQKNQQTAQGVFPGSLISVPVFAEKQLLGILNISHPDSNYFTDWHIRLLHIYKNMLGQLITNCRLFQKMEKQIANRTEKLEKALKNVEQLKDRYENLAMIDDLTGLFNRRYFFIQAEMAIANTIRYGQLLCVLVIDIDFFKKLNDTYGHQCGDQVLVHVAELLKAQMRDSDILVRYGGEEFIVIFTNTDCQKGKIFAERIRETIETSVYDFKDNQLKTTVSIGVYCLDQAHAKQGVNNIDEIIHCADLALYEAKAVGRNQVVVFNEKLLSTRQN